MTFSRRTAAIMPPHYYYDDAERRDFEAFRSVRRDANTPRTARRERFDYLLQSRRRATGHAFRTASPRDAADMAYARGRASQPLLDANTYLAPSRYHAQAATLRPSRVKKPRTHYAITSISRASLHAIIIFDKILGISLAMLHMSKFTIYHRCHESYFSRARFHSTLRAFQLITPRRTLRPSATMI